VNIKTRLARLEAGPLSERARATRELTDMQDRILGKMSDADLHLLEAGASPGATEDAIVLARTVWERAVRKGLDDPSVDGRRS